MGAIITHLLFLMMMTRRRALRFVMRKGTNWQMAYSFFPRAHFPFFSNLLVCWELLSIYFGKRNMWRVCVSACKFVLMAVLRVDGWHVIQKTLEREIGFFFLQKEKNLQAEMSKTLWVVGMKIERRGKWWKENNDIACIFCGWIRSAGALRLRGRLGLCSFWGLCKKPVRSIKLKAGWNG